MFSLTLRSDSLILVSLDFMFPRAAVVILFVLLAVTPALLVVTELPVGSVALAKHMRIAADIQAFSVGLKQYESMNGSFPTTQQGLQALVEEPAGSPRPSRWRQFVGYIPKDPWNNEYIYRCPGATHPDGYDLFSAGPDHKPYTADDDWGR